MRQLAQVLGGQIAQNRTVCAMVDEDGHYSFAAPLWCGSPPHAATSKSATACNI